MLEGWARPLPLRFAWNLQPIDRVRSLPVIELDQGSIGIGCPPLVAGRSGGAEDQCLDGHRDVGKKLLAQMAEQEGKLAKQHAGGPSGQGADQGDPDRAGLPEIEQQRRKPLAQRAIVGQIGQAPQHSDGAAARAPQFGLNARGNESLPFARIQQQLLGCLSSHQVGLTGLV